MPWWLDIALPLVPEQVPAAAVPLLFNSLAYNGCLYLAFPNPTLFGAQYIYYFPRRISQSFFSPYGPQSPFDNVHCAKSLGIRMEGWAKYDFQFVMIRLKDSKRQYFSIHTHPFPHIALRLRRNTITISAFQPTALVVLPLRFDARDWPDGPRILVEWLCLCISGTHCW